MGRVGNEALVFVENFTHKNSSLLPLGIPTDGLFLLILRSQPTGMMGVILHSNEPLITWGTLTKAHMWLYTTQLYFAIFIIRPLGIAWHGTDIYFYFTF